MDVLTLALVGLAAASSVAVAVAAWRRPILWRLAVRNAWRRPKQTLTVVAGLMVGTAIISSALVAGDSARGAIRGYVYQSLGDVDESVAVPGYAFFPQPAFEALRGDEAVRSGFDAVSAHAIWQGTGEAPRTGLFEPSVALVGFEPEADAAFGTFALRGGGETDARGLQPGQAIATAYVADALGLQPGDQVTVSYVLPFDPILPRVHLFRGNATGAGVPSLPGSPPTSGTLVHTVEVEAGAAFLTAVLAWDPTVRQSPAPPSPPLSSLGLRVVAPNGTVHEAEAPPPGSQVPALVVNVTVPPDQTLPPGSWRIEVRPSAAVRAAYGAAALVGYPVYDPALLQERAEELRRLAGPLRDLVPGLGPQGTLHSANLTVVAIAEGGRASLFDLRSAFFVRLDDAQALFQRPGQVNLAKFSNPGDRVAGEAGTEAANATLQAAVARVQAQYAGLPSVQALEVKLLKRDFLQQADAKGQTLTGLLVFAGSLSIITGLLLILNIFTMLAQERRSELGMARAIGLTRGDLVRMSVFEGSLYAVAAAAIGALLGFGLAFAMIGVMNTIVSRLSRDLSFPPIEYAPSLEAFLVAFSLGALLTFVTIVLAARHQSRLNVVRAIRRIEDPEVAGSRRLAFAVGLPLAAVGLAAAAAAWMPGFAAYGGYRFTAQVATAAVAALGIGLLLRPFVRRRRLVPGLAALLGTYYTATFFLVTDFTNRSESNVVGPLRGVLLAICVVILAVHAEGPLRALGRAMGRSRTLRPLALPALSYPLHRKFRTGMTLAMFSIVLLSIGFFSIFGALFQVDPLRQTGGFDVEARATLGVGDLDAHAAGLASLRGVVQERHELPEFRSEDRKTITVNGTQVGTFRDYRHVVYGYDAAFARSQDFALIERLPEYATDQAAYDGVLARTDQVIVSYLYSTSPEGQAFAHHAGDRLELHYGGQTLTYTIAGIQEQYHFPGIFLPKETVDGLFPGTSRVYLFKLDPQADPVAVAQDLEREYRAVGLDAKPTVQEVLDEQESFRQLLGAMKLFLGLGLLVGVLSLGIVTSRSVLERRQEIGMMRALGYTGREVRRVFLIEVTATILLGALIGIACAIVVTYGLWFAVVRELNYPYVVPWAEVGLLVLVSYVVALLATWAPIGRTGKVPPAEALRYVE